MGEDCTGPVGDTDSFADGLPDRFPDGTRYIIEGRRSSQGGLRVQSRYLEFPDGRHVELPIELVGRTRSARARRSVRARVRGRRATG